MDTLEEGIKDKLARLNPEAKVECLVMVGEEGGAWNFDELPPPEDDDLGDLRKWLGEAEDDLSKPEPPPESTAIEQRISELEVGHFD